MGIMNMMEHHQDHSSHNTAVDADVKFAAMSPTTSSSTRKTTTTKADSSLEQQLRRLSLMREGSADTPPTSNQSQQHEELGFHDSVLFNRRHQQQQQQHLQADCDIVDACFRRKIAATPCSAAFNSSFATVTTVSTSTCETNVVAPAPTSSPAACTRSSFQSSCSSLNSISPFAVRRKSSTNNQQQQINQMNKQTPSPTRQRRRRVSFTAEHEKDIHSIQAIQDMTDDDKSNTWYQRYDFDVMKQDALQTISKMNNNKKIRRKDNDSDNSEIATDTSEEEEEEEETELCSWGLTPRTRLGSRLRRTRRVSAIKCVLEQQDDLYWMMISEQMDNNSESATNSTTATSNAPDVIIASVYRSLSLPSEQEAYQTGIDIQKEVLLERKSK